MAQKAAYCPRCGSILILGKSKDKEEYNKSVCKYCGFNDGFVDFDYDFNKIFNYIDEHFGKGASMTCSTGDMYLAAIDVYNINKNPQFSMELFARTYLKINNGSLTINANSDFWTNYINQKEEVIEERRKQYEAEKARKQRMDEVYQKMHNQPHCPTCGSTNIKKLDVVDRAVSVGMFGLASNKINKSFKCKNCGHTW